MTGVLSAGFLVTVVPLFLILGLIAVRGVSAIDANLFTERARPELTEDQFAQYKQWQAGEAAYPKDDFGDPVKRGGLGHAMLGSAIMVLLAIRPGGAPRAGGGGLPERGAELAAGGGRAVRHRIARRGAVHRHRPVRVRGAGGPGATRGCAAPSLPLKPSAWAGAVALAIMMIPVVVRSAEEAMKLVPDSLRQASYALRSEPDADDHESDPAGSVTGHRHRHLPGRRPHRRGDGPLLWRPASSTAGRPRCRTTRRSSPGTSTTTPAATRPTSATRRGARRWCCWRWSCW